MNSHINSRQIIFDIEPDIALARAECLEDHRERPAQKPRAFDLMKDARRARSMYQRDLLLQFIKFLASRLPFARSPRHGALSYPLQPSASVAHPRGV